MTIKQCQENGQQNIKKVLIVANQKDFHKNNIVNIKINKQNVLKYLKTYINI